jgi:hypothetical protein
MQKRYNNINKYGSNNRVDNRGNNQQTNKHNYTPINNVGKKKEYIPIEQIIKKINELTYNNDVYKD